MAKDLSKWYEFEVIESLRHYFFDRAELEDSKAKIMKRVNAIKAEADKRGSRFYTLLFFALAREGLQKMQYHNLRSQPPPQDFLEIIKAFTREWDETPELRNARVLAELL